MMVNNNILTYICTHSYVTTTLSWDIDYGTVSNVVPAESPRLSEVKISFGRRIVVLKVIVTVVSGFTFSS